MQLFLIVSMMFICWNVKIVTFVCKLPTYAVISQHLSFFFFAMHSLGVNAMETWVESAKNKTELAFSLLFCSILTTVLISTKWWSHSFQRKPLKISARSAKMKTLSFWSTHAYDESQWKWKCYISVKFTSSSFHLATLCRHFLENHPTIQSRCS